MQKAISVENLSVNYGDYCALHDISFSVERGDFLAVVGQNGSGKTTLIKTIAGLIKPAAGRVIFHDQNDIIGYLPQKSSILDSRFPANVEEVVLSGMRRKTAEKTKENAQKIGEKLQETLNLLQISDLRKRKIGQLSGGQQQRVILARALISSPTVLILDEPTGALDPSSRECFYDTIQEMSRTQGSTVIMVSHDFHDIEKYVKTVALIDRILLSYTKSQNFLSGESTHYFSHCDCGGAHEKSGEKCKKS